MVHTMEEKHTLLTSFKNHKYGIEKVKFFHVTGISFSLDNGKDGTAYKNGIRFLKEASKRTWVSTFLFS